MRRCGYALTEVSAEKFTDERGNGEINRMKQPQSLPEPEGAAIASRTCAE
jgi:hypothetical protein